LIEGLRWLGGDVVVGQSSLKTGSQRDRFAFVYENGKMRSTDCGGPSC